MAIRHSAYLTAPATLEIRSSSLPKPGPTQILIKAHAVAVNPVDDIFYKKGTEFFKHLSYPALFGGDVSGEVIDIGSSIAPSRVKIGDRVFGYANMTAFQSHVLLDDNLFTVLPSNVSLVNASVVPLTFRTAATGLFRKDYLALPYPSLNPKPLNKTLLVWSGASSVGSNAIQLGVAAGCDVITTCSPKNFALVKKLGASETWDYKDPNIVQEILSYLQDKVLAGAVGIGNVTEILAQNDTASPLILEIVSKAPGNRFVAMANLFFGSTPEGVTNKFIEDDASTDAERSVIYKEYLGPALAEGKFVPAPAPLVVGHGLESLEKAFEVVAKGVSAQKVVVTL